jgi:hypothetical protein
MKGLDKLKNEISDDERCDFFNYFNYLNSLSFDKMIEEDEYQEICGDAFTNLEFKPVEVDFIDPYLMTMGDAMNGYCTVCGHKVCGHLPG